MDFSSRFSRRNFVKTAAATAGAATLGSALAACGSSGGSSSTITLNYWDYFVSQAPWIDNEIKLFEKAHSGIKIKKTIQLSSSYANLYALAVKSHNTPDVAMIPGQPNFNIQVSQGWFMPVDKWANAAWKAKFPEGTFHEGNNVFNGKLYSAPISGAAPWLQLYISNKVFRDAGLVNSDGSVKIPRTWDDVTHAAETIVKKSGGSTYGLGFGNSGGSMFQWLTHVFTLGAGAVGGGYTMDYRVGKYTYSTDRNYYEFISLFKEWKNKGYVYPNAVSISDEVSRAYFERAKYGMTIGGVWNQAEWTTHNFTDYSLTTLLCPTETPKGYFPTSPGGTLWAIPAQTKHPEEAWAWFDWLYSVDAGKRWTQQFNEDLSAFPQNNDSSKIKFKPFAQFVGLSKFALPAPDPSISNPQTAHVEVQTVKPNLDDVIAGYYTGQLQDLHAALSDIEGRMQKAQDDAVKVAQQKGFKVSPDDYKFTDWDPTKPYITKPAQS
ncbi:sugar ABC transporter substrate-binding protein [Ktedonobacter sp. SOSP1-52]|uniref:ABC transporter substrate-binding protein n=1 Tax=Ktedonobacter sp. SOSP1-52 TaxID=2778366 RepID=UPI0019165505|nr:extracellular solute-binding protein [Ktedonobacter sp. SOSP1-52]GHO69882.1 sugar ABC transporter substrate-binding protein [Ktedonobacter sp. SOSP1-52]